MKIDLYITARDFQAYSQVELNISREELRATPQADGYLAVEVAERMSNPQLIRGLGGTALEVVTIGPENADNVTFVSYG